MGKRGDLRGGLALGCVAAPLKRPPLRQLSHCLVRCFRASFHRRNIAITDNAMTGPLPAGYSTLVKLKCVCVKCWCRLEIPTGRVISQVPPLRLHTHTPQSCAHFVSVRCSSLFLGNNQLSGTLPLSMSNMVALG